METYLQTAWGDQWENITMDIVKKAIEGLREMDGEHVAFWVGLIKEDENVLEVSKDLCLIGTFEDELDFQYKGQGKDWKEIESLFGSFLSDNHSTIKRRLKRVEK